MAFEQIRTTQPDPEWYECLKERGLLFGQPVEACCDRCAPLQPLMQNLKEILSIVGHVAILPHIEQDIIELLDRGEFIDPIDPIFTHGTPSECHGNAARFWSENKESSDLMTGYALSKSGGVWRQHTWCILTHDPVTNEELPEDKVVETTASRILYYGYRLTPEEAYKFELTNPFCEDDLWL